MFDRRGFFYRAAAVGTLASAGSVFPTTLLPSRAVAQPGTPLAAVDAFTLDTLRGTIVMVFPGPDEWSRVQGTPRDDPGIIEWGAAEFMKDLFDRYLAAGDQVTRPVTLALSEALNDMGVPAPPFLGVSREQGRTIDEAIGYAYSDRVLPLSLPIALILNLGAVVIAPNSLVGPLGSPFSRLSLGDKCRVLQLVEQPLPELVSIFDQGLPVPLESSLSGFLRFAGGIILEASAFGVYSEMELWDRQARRVTARPVSWDLMSYRPNGLVDGHPEFLGYYQGRTEVATDA
ncbi:hypothetical protein C6A87_021915 [Mycobacterium sp. ITM-2016-00317]|uniref:hypothetical protein n=1 Tax=Mycobacterium sp. ITM-2016-00317 TaxID=2099694 RepID=UPI00287F8E83|nr:hypothetical protein [Mycobacterium sp. ITM-2016-00317]WNG86472.1 hypothetical protein C6A87_021915 [Mycobacterium sp. ITM-2016-00317]